jgi:hypothetical protein
MLAQSERATKFPWGSWLALAEDCFRLIGPIVHVPLVGASQLHDVMKRFSTG